MFTEPNIKKYELTDEDTCIVCLEPVTTLAKTNIENYITKCCKHFLCKNCIRGMQASVRTLSCPYCRNVPLSLDPVNINLATKPAIATTVPNATIPAQNV